MKGGEASETALCIFYWIYIYFMSKGNPLVVRKSEQIATPKGTTVQHTYVIYSPKIIKFIYNSKPNKTLLDLQVRDIERSIELRQTRKKEKVNGLEQVNNGNSGKHTKIKLVSRKQTEESQKNNRSMVDSLCSEREKGTVKLKKTRKLKTYSDYENKQKPQLILKNHITVEPLIPLINCDIFSGCGQVDTYEDNKYDYSHHQQTVQSRLIHPELKYKYKQEKVGKGEKEEQSQRKSRLSVLNQTFKERKRIFQGKHKLNKSVDFHQERPKGRKNIFEFYNPRNSRSFSHDLSLTKRYKIFDSYKADNNQTNSRLLKEECKELQISQQQIPRSILQNWREKTMFTQIQEQPEQSFSKVKPS